MTHDNIKTHSAQLPPKSSGPYKLLTIGLGLLSVAYIAVEFAFNSLVIDTVAGIPTIDETHSLELIGRTVSGFGLIFIAWGFIIRRSTQSLTMQFLLLVLSAIICFPAMFYGQKYLVDKIVDASTGSQRLQSKYMSLLRTGLSEGIIAIDGIPFDSTKPQTAEDKTFLSLVGSLIYFNPQFLSTVEKNQDQIIKEIILRTSTDSVDEGYKEYLKIRESVSDYWNKYQKGSKSYLNAVSNSNNKSLDAWVDMNTEILKSWSSFDSGRNNWYEKWGKQSLKYYGQTDRLFRTWARCKSESCRNKSKQNYAKRMQQLFKCQDIPYTFWCKKLLLGFLKNKAYGHQVGNMQCPSRKKDFTPKFIAASAVEFQNTTGLNIRVTEAQFILSNKVRKDTVAKLKRDGINLPSTWRLNDKQMFVRTVTEHANKKAMRQFDREVKRFLKEDTIKPGLTYSAFVKSTAVQNTVKAEMGSAYIKGMRFNWSKETFFTRSIEPKIKKKVQDEIAKLKNGAEAYENGNSLEESGKQSMRSILVPPIAITFSLFFGLWNLFNLGTSILIAGLGRFSTKKVKRSISIIILTSILIAPLFIGSYYADNKVVAYFVDEARKTHQVLGHVFDWVIRTQPIIYPAGKSIRDTAPDIRKNLSTLTKTSS